MAAHVRRRDGISYFDEETTSSLRVARSNVFSSYSSYGNDRGDNTLTSQEARSCVFSPVDPSFVAAFAALKVSFPGACPGKDDLLF